MPTRYLKPGICDSESIENCTPMAECLYYRLLVNVDDYGRLDARSAVIKARCFPLKDIKTSEIDELLVMLVRAKLIQMYTTVNGSRYLQFCKWDNVPRSKESKFPAFDDSCIQLYTDVCEAHTNLPVTETVTVTKTVTETKPAAAFALPDWIDKATWDLWLKTRKGKKMIPEQMQAQVDKLAKWRDAGLDHAKALHDAATNGWQGLFEPTQKGKTPKQDNFDSKDYGQGVSSL